jgi:arylsulfatase A-like enzyme
MSYITARILRHSMLGAGCAPFTLLLSLSAVLRAANAAPEKPNIVHRPNIVLAFADDWSWPMPAVADNAWIQTPTFDRVAREGVVFSRAYVAAPSCSPSRAALLTGQWHWRLEEGANLWSTLPAKFPVYPDLLESAGYHVGYMGKGWGPGSDTAGGRTRNPAGKSYRSFPEFLAARPAGKPFCFWFGSHNPHRAYRPGSGIAAGLKPADVKVPACLPDNDITRSDLCDYALAVKKFDSDTGEILKAIEAGGELENTIVAMSGDNGMPFPRCKANLYDTGTRVPLAIRWAAKVKPGRSVEDFVSLTDLCPTFLEAAGQPVPAEVTGRSLIHILQSDKSGQVDAKRDHVLTGMERHASPCRDGAHGYPMRAYRTGDFLYLRNFAADRWPAGDPMGFRDIDNGPTKKYIVEHREDPGVKPFFELACGKRPSEELYDLKNDPAQIKNVAADPVHAETLKRLSAALTAELKATGDPRIVGGAEKIDEYPYRR